MACNHAGFRPLFAPNFFQFGVFLCFLCFVFIFFWPSGQNGSLVFSFICFLLACRAGGCFLCGYFGLLGSVERKEEAIKSCTLLSKSPDHLVRPYTSPSTHHSRHDSRAAYQDSYTYFLPDYAL